MLYLRDGVAGNLVSIVPPLVDEGVVIVLVGHEVGRSARQSQSAPPHLMAQPFGLVCAGSVGVPNRTS